jgi:ABC-type glycerol-3-phosphate transport system permease component
MRMKIIEFIKKQAETMPGPVLAILPILVVFLFFQRYFIEGMTAGGVKG